MEKKQFMNSNNDKKREMKRDIQEVVSELMEKVINRVLNEDPFIPEEHRTKKPLYAALVPKEIFKGSHFERRFVTPFGKLWEKLAIVAAENGMGHGEMDYKVEGKIKEGRLRRISEVLNKLEHGVRGGDRIKPNWEEELQYILEGDGDPVDTTVICDVLAENTTTGEKFVFELKAPLPNSDQTKVSKEKIFKLHSMEPETINEAYFALPYNPYGKKEDYAWSFPARWFDMNNDPCVLIGIEFWEKIGGEGTYRAFIEAVNEIGVEYKEQIYREYLGIEPPNDLGEESL